MRQVMMMAISFFAAYGVIRFLAESIFLLRSRKGNKPVCLHRVLGLSNAEEEAEGILRSMLWEGRDEELIVLDFDSSDETEEILNRLKREYPQIRVMHPLVYASYIRGLYEESKMK